MTILKKKHFIGHVVDGPFHLFIYNVKDDEKDSECVTRETVVK